MAATPRVEDARVVDAPAPTLGILKEAKADANAP
jgi:hypothetical protein